MIALLLDRTRGHFRRRIPDAVIIGFAKCGTGALLEMLASHSKIVQTEEEEVHYYDKYIDKGPAWYLAQMPKARDDQLIIEKTPMYVHMPEVPRLLLETNPKTKVLAILCDPVTRALSGYAMMEAKERLNASSVHEPSGGLDKLWLLGTEGPLVIDKVSPFLWRGAYELHLRPWLDQMPPGQLLVLDGGVLVSRPWEEMSKAQSFLGVEVEIGKDDFVANAHKGRFYCWKTKGENPMSHCMGDTKGRDHYALDEETETELRRFFEPYNNKLAERLGRNLSFTNAGFDS